MDPREGQSVVISSTEDVERLRSSLIGLLRLEGPIELRIPGVEPAERERIQSRLSELAGVCGCAAGSVTGALALITVVVFWIQRGVEFSPGTIIAAMATIVAIALFAKFLHVASARMRLYTALGRLRGVSPVGAQPRHREGIS